MSRTHLPTRRSHRLGVLGAAAILALLPAACGGDDDVATPDPGVAPAGGEAPTDAPVGDGVPKECATFIGIIEPADPAVLDTLPADWPEPPAGSTLCSGSGSGGTTTVQYATDVAPAEILAHYESELGADWNVAREAGAGDEILTGYRDAIGIQVQPRDGGFRIALADDAV
ncbi:hypothetical protein [Actinomarinicola tropica]|uniref:DUF3558 domain-containing protein n=1 Tax=Actinomarinicola tropica TaxID=2789776 RepID=A0A5Q2RRI3_9ACTN|nr:hypothetical protein [Actinomarinicola tropica]QGG95795.1 hypothetical protein GH723_12190 [Actinomarinicola tropica]